MKKIIFYVLEGFSEEKIVMYHNRFRNSLISFEDSKFYFNSKIYDSKEEIKYSFSFLELNEELGNTLWYILEKAYLVAKNISNENMGDEYIVGSIQSAIMSSINKFLYLEIGSIDIFDLVTELFVKLLMGHYLRNGNKRLALTFLKGVLWHFGYYLKFTEGIWKNYSKHKTVVEEFVTKLETKVINDKEAQIIKIKKWIENNVIIGLNWRG